MSAKFELKLRNQLIGPVFCKIALLRLLKSALFCLFALLFCQVAMEITTKLQLEGMSEKDKSQVRKSSNQRELT